MKSIYLSMLFSLMPLGQAAAQLVVNCHGAGQLVYLIGGGPAFTTWNLTPIQQRLGHDFKVCRWDMRGVGDNAQLDIKNNMTVLDQWIKDMADVLPESPVVLWGHSWGALQVLLFARQYPDRVKAIVLTNPVDPALSSLEGIESKRYLHADWAPDLTLEDVDTPAEQVYRFRSKIASYVLDAKLGWQYAAGFRLKDSNRLLNVQVWDAYRQAPLAVDEVQHLAPKIKCIIYCQQDVLMPENFRAYAKLVSAKQQIRLNGCAHFPWLEQPKAFYKALLGAITAD